jgi:hypothetical protein
MKPTNGFRQRNARRESCLPRARRTFPLSDQFYQGHSIGGSGSATAGDATGKSSFREISRGYLKREMLETFIGEAAFFSIITIMAAFGLMVCADALAHFVQAVGAT